MENINRQQTKQILFDRLQNLKEWRKSDKWINPHSSSETNGYNQAVDKEIKFLSDLIDKIGG